eukprot:m.105264 g.105264  ORF g.105264 m.105264 type:complete len:633 (+) comp13277_c0_seq2:138-2036(+)
MSESSETVHANSSNSMPASACDDTNDVSETEAKREKTQEQVEAGGEVDTEGDAEADTEAEPPALTEVDRIVDTMVEDPCYVVPGAAKRWMPDDFAVVGSGSKPCPIEGCAKSYSTTAGLAKHVTSATCTPKVNFDIFSDRIKQAEKQKRAVEAQPGRRRQRVFVRDRGFFPSYRWPQLGGSWWVPLVYVRALLKQRTFIPTGKQAEEWRLRTMSSKEIFFSLRYDVFLPVVVARKQGTQIVDADVVLKWITENSPELYQDYADMSRTPVGAGDRNQMLRAIASLTQGVLSDVTSFNNSLAQARTHRAHSYDPWLQTIHTPRTQHVLFSYEKHTDSATELPFQRSCASVTPLSSQFEIAQPAIPVKVDSVLHVEGRGARKSFDIAQVHREYLLHRMQKKLEGMPRVLPHVAEDIPCAVCGYTAAEGVMDSSTYEELLECSECERASHLKCLNLEPELAFAVTKYKWQCLECKVCDVCSKSDDEKHILFCDECDRGYHTYCVGLTSLPRGRWVCHSCGSCDSCGMRPTDSTYKWHHMFNREEKPFKFLATLCSDCASLWDAGQFCPVCLGVYTLSTEQEMICCDVCERWVHISCEGLTESQEEHYTKEGTRYTCTLCAGVNPELFDVHHRKYQA